MTLSVCHNFLKGLKLHFHAPIGALVYIYLCIHRRIIFIYIIYLSKLLNKYFLQLEVKTLPVSREILLIRKLIRIIIHIMYAKCTMYVSMYVHTYIVFAVQLA